MESLPVLNYGSTGREVLAAKITEVMGDLGFLYLENIPGFNEDELRWCVDFFYGLPLEKRMQIGRKTYRSENKNVSMRLCMSDLRLSPGQANVGIARPSAVPGKGLRDRYYSCSILGKTDKYSCSLCLI